MLSQNRGSQTDELSPSARPLRTSCIMDILEELQGLWSSTCNCSGLIVNPGHPLSLRCPNNKSHDFRTFSYQSSRSFSLGFRLLAPNIQIGMRQFFLPIGVTAALATRLNFNALCVLHVMSIVVSRFLTVRCLVWR